MSESGVASPINVLNVLVSREARYLKVILKGDKAVWSESGRLFQAAAHTKIMIIVINYFTHNHARGM